MTEARTAGGRLNDLELPVVVAGCLLTRAEGTRSTYALDSRGPLRGQHVTVFDARSDTAVIHLVKKYGLLRVQEHTMPTERHV